MLDAGMSVQRGFDLAKLDTESTDFDLLVGASRECNLAIRQVAAEVARAVDAISSRSAVGIGEEALRGRRRVGPRANYRRDQVCCRRCW